MPTARRNPLSTLRRNAEQHLSLSVRNFSCISHADIRVNRLTVLIGPQASGKSLLSKLIYFFNSIAQQQQFIDSIAEDIDTFKEGIRRQFQEWFPISAWGPGKFRIEYRQGDYELKLMRSVYGGVVGDSIKIGISKFVEELQSTKNKIYRAAMEKRGAEDGFEPLYRAQDQLREIARDHLGNAYVSSQIFVPAGRSFFTSMGRAVTAFEHARLLDPITIAFGKRMTNLRDRGPLSNMSRSRAIWDQAAPLLGGKVILGRSGDYIETPDGRKVPFGSLSSGQQELLPLIMALAPMGTILAAGASRLVPAGRRFICVEEPEAHLFPSAQSAVVEFLAAFAQPRARNDVLVTTHSPYVLSKINNLIYAGSLALKMPEGRRTALSRIIKPNIWLSPGDVSAYAVKDGVVEDILEDDGLVSGDYLDEISGSISQEFNSLLELG